MDMRDKDAIKGFRFCVSNKNRLTASINDNYNNYLMEKLAFEELH